MPDAAPEVAPDDPSSPQTPSRRRFLRRLAALTAGAAGTGVLLAGCGGRANEDAGGSAAAAAGSTRSGSASASPSSAGAHQCVAPSALSQEAKAGRKKYEYVADSPHPQKHCSNCQFWVAAEANETCGGCRLFSGPVHPQGYCNAWLRA